MAAGDAAEALAMQALISGAVLSMLHELAKGVLKQPVSIAAPFEPLGRIEMQLASGIQVRVTVQAEPAPGADGDGEPARPSPYDLWRQAGGGTPEYSHERYHQLLREHGHLVSGARQPLPCGWPHARRRHAAGPSDQHEEAGRG